VEIRDWVATSDEELTCPLTADTAGGEDIQTSLGIAARLVDVRPDFSMSFERILLGWRDNGGSTSLPHAHIKHVTSMGRLALQTGPAK